MTTLVSLELLEKFMIDVFIGLGLPRADAEVCANVLITADRRGIDSHGIGRLKPIYYDRIKEGIVSPITNIEVVKETPTTAVIDGHNGMGHVIGKHSMALAIKKARKLGLGMVACRNSSHYGIAGYYALMATESDMVGITGTNARPSIAPTFGVENMLGTNPITIGAPSDEPFPFLIDCATSVTQRGKIEVLDRLNQETPDGWVVGAKGKSRSDTHKILQDLVSGTAALLPLGGEGDTAGGHKGYGYATAVEILSAALQNGNFLKALSGYKDGKKIPYNLGHYFLAINPEFFVGVEAFKKTAGNILRQLRASRKAPGSDRIYTAGEKEYTTALEKDKNGTPVTEPLQKEMIIMRDELGLTQYHFNFEPSAQN
ncbi:MAG: Ldh family oxidoreductase [Candidatus Auribacterota bacterium]|nr:Ldh family oxidoreductase [Candidatus Auribacterota bacterium]